MVSRYPSPRERLKQVREHLAVALDTKDVTQVEECFRELLRSVYAQPLSSDELLSVAACMLGARNHDLAVRAYRQHLQHYRQSSRNPEICFRLGILFSRRFHDYDEALKYLTLAAQSHTRSDRVARAEEEIRRVRENLDRVDASPSTVTGTSERAWVVRQTDDPINLGQVGRLVAREAGRVLAEVTAELRRSRGTILSGAPVDVARRVARELQQIGVPVLVIGEQDLVSLPEPLWVSRVVVSGEGCRFEMGEQARPVAWRDVYFVVAGQLRTGTAGGIEPVNDSPASIGFGYHGTLVPHRRFVSTRGTEERVLLLDFFLYEPWQRLRVQVGETHCVLRTLEGGTKNTSDPEEFVRGLVAANPEISGNEFLHLISAGGYQREARRFEFDSLLAFNSYCHWLLQLEEHNRPPEPPGS